MSEWWKDPKYWNREKRTKEQINVLYPLQKEFDVVSVHDSIRCKESDYDKVLNKIEEIFNKIQFKCTLKNKTEKVMKEEIKQEMKEYNEREQLDLQTVEDNIKLQERKEFLDIVFEEFWAQFVYNELKGKKSYITVYKHKQEVYQLFMDKIDNVKRSELKQILLKQIQTIINTK
jgi:hypothetical protein